MSFLADKSSLTTPIRIPSKVLTVGNVVSRIRELISREFPSPVWIEGAISNFSTASSGHMYFDLVDEEAADKRGQHPLVPCAFFKNANQHIRFEPEDGMKVLSLAEVTTYEARGQYQLRVLRLEPKGVGILQVAFEQLKKRLLAEGLFDEDRKRPIPRLPDKVGVITSRTGSAVHDMVRRLRGRFHVIVLPVKVQGEGSREEIAQAITIANLRKLADVIIVGRGGGSIEDLWAFNEEVVARSIAASKIPVISAVGHEDDWTIADYVADLRASTPTHAAQALAHKRYLLIEEARDLVVSLVNSMQALLEDNSNRVQSLTGKLRLLHPIHQLDRYLRRRNELQTQLVASSRHSLMRYRQHLEGLSGRLHALSPLAVLARGYTITLKLPNRNVITDSKMVKQGDELETLLAKGRIISKVLRSTTNTSEKNGTIT